VGPCLKRPLCQERSIVSRVNSRLKCSGHTRVFCECECQDLLSDCLVRGTGQLRGECSLQILMQFEPLVFFNGVGLFIVCSIGKQLSYFVF
jgi:hypothetical protein